MNSINQRGFTATEVMIAIAIVSIVVMGIFTLYIGQHSSYVHQQEVLQLQQQMRVALNKIVKEVRMAGYDPTGENETTPNTFGIQTAQANLIYFTADRDDVDLNEDGDLNDPGDFDQDEDGNLDLVNGDIDSKERYRFRVNNNKVEYSDDNGAAWQSLTWQSLVAQVEAVSITFAYYVYDENDVEDELEFPISVEDLDDIRVVRITLTERVKLSGVAVMYNSKTLSSRVELRNI